MTQFKPTNMLMTITVIDLNNPETNGTIVGRVIRVTATERDVDVYYLEDPAGSDDSVLKVTVDARDGYEAEARE